MILGFDGFDHYVPNGTEGQTVQKYLTAAGYEIRNASAQTFSIVEGRRDGASALRFTVVSGNSVNASFSNSVQSDADLVVFGFAFRSSGARMRICRIENIVDVDWDTENGKMKVGEIEGVNPMIMNAWYYIEVEVEKSTKEVRVWLNNELQLTAPWSGTQPDKYTLTFGQTSRLEVNGNQDFDDMYVLDSSPGERMARLEPSEVANRPPTVDIKTEWHVVGSSTSNHWEVASQLLALEGGKPYLQSNIDGHADIFRSNAVLPNANLVHGVAVTTLARKGDLDDRSIGILLRDGSQTEETSFPLTEEYQYFQKIYEKSPSGAAWNQNSVESAEFGVVAR